MVFRWCVSLHVSLRVSSNVLIYDMFYHSENRRMASPRCVYEGVSSAKQAESTTVHSVYTHNSFYSFWFASLIASWMNGVCSMFPFVISPSD